MLIFDDEPHICKAVELVLGGDGLETDVANSPPEYFRKLKEEDPDLVLLDVVMPMSGVDVLKQTRKMKPNVKVVMLTVVGSEAFKEHYKELGAVDYINKPFNNNDLVKRVKRIVCG